MLHNELLLLLLLVQAPKLVVPTGLPEISRMLLGVSWTSQIRQGTGQRGFDSPWQVTSCGIGSLLSILRVAIVCNSKTVYSVWAPATGILLCECPQEDRVLGSLPVSAAADRAVSVPSAPFYEYVVFPVRAPFFYHYTALRAVPSLIICTCKTTNLAPTGMQCTEQQYHLHTPIYSLHHPHLVLAAARHLPCAVRISKKLHFHSHGMQFHPRGSHEWKGCTDPS